MFDIYVNSFNRVESLKALVEQLVNLEGRGRVTILDNNSTLPQVRDLLNSFSSEIRVIFSETNHGPRGAFHLANNEQSEPFVITDPDLDLSDCPLDLLFVLKEGLERYPEHAKSGPSLRIDDLPESLNEELKNSILSSEGRYWQTKLDENWYEAPIDTTFALCLPRAGFTYSAIRSAPPYCVRHLPWYLLSDEDLRYIEALPDTFKTGLSWSTIVSNNKQKAFS